MALPRLLIGVGAAIFLLTAGSCYQPAPSRIDESTLRTLRGGPTQESDRSRRLTFSLLPNLVPDQPAQFLLAGNQLRVTAIVRNTGRRPASAFDVRIEVYKDYVFSGEPPLTTLRYRFPGLNPGQAESRELDARGDPATVDIPPRPPGGADLYLQVKVIVDPPTQDRLGGEVPEADEHDNLGIFDLEPIHF